MSVTELRGKIATVNATASRLNEQRVRNMGMRETLEKQKADAIATYLEKYGVDLNVVNVQEEFQRVMDVKQAEVNLMTEVIACIDGGDFTRANQLLQIGVSDAKRVETSPSPAVVSTATEVPQVSPIETPVSAPIQTPVQTPIQTSVPMSGVESLVAPTPSVAPAPSVAPTPIQTPTPAVAPPPMSGLGAVGSTPVAPPVAPPPLGMPTTHHAVGSGLDLSSLQVNAEVVNRATDFSSILGGQQFTP